MATYWDTLRSETKIIDGVEIGRYSYAYKESSSDRNYPGGPGRRVSAAESLASDAQYKNKKVRHFICADTFATAADEEGYWVWQIDRDPPMTLCEIPKDALIVGYLRREGRRFVFRRIEARKAS
jgi:hypothetical protein